MIAAFSGLIWVVFAAALLACAAVLTRVLLLLLRHLKAFKAAAAEATQRLNEAVGEVNSLLQQATEGMEKLESRRIRDR